MSASRMLKGSIALFAQVWASQDHTDLFSDDDSFTSLLQLQHSPRTSSRTGSSSQTGSVDPFAPRNVTVSPASGSIHFVGRYHTDTGADAVLFDAVGFEIQFQVTGATEVKVALSQRISGPNGWWFDAHVEDDWKDACFIEHPEGWTRPRTALWQGASSQSQRAAMFPQGSQPQHFLVYVDGVPQLEPLEEKSRCIVCTFDTSDAVSEEEAEYIVATGLDADQAHDIRIVKTSEPDFTSAPAAVPNWIALHSLILDGGSVELLPPRSRKIEFVGDSWMSGYCDTCSGGMCEDGVVEGSSMRGDPSDTFRWGSYALAWPHLLCEDAQAECHSTMLSGIGVECVTHNASDAPRGCSEDFTLPLYWQRTLASDSSIPWDFDMWTPDILVAAVSTNEHWDDASTDREAVLNGYDEFLDLVYEKHPDVQVLLVCLDPQVEEMCRSVEERVAVKVEGGAQVSLLDVTHHPEFSTQTKCCGHPDKDYHRILKDNILEKVQEIMNWHDLE